jgi:hypothetical protein
VSLNGDIGSVIEMDVTGKQDHGPMFGEWGIWPRDELKLENIWNATHSHFHSNCTHILIMPEFNIVVLGGKYNILNRALGSS